jgi:hypothetical protein
MALPLVLAMPSLLVGAGARHQAAACFARRQAQACSPAEA